MSDSRVAVISGSAAGFANTITIGPHRLTADEPVAAGGSETGPRPHELLSAALGACMSMTVSSYARRKQWPLHSVTVRVQHARVPASECAECRTREGLVDRLEVELELVGPLNDEQRTRLLEIAGRCPVHRTLRSEINIRSRLA